MDTSRYQVTCEKCKTVKHYTILESAVSIANAHADDGCKGITVFDGQKRVEIPFRFTHEQSFAMFQALNGVVHHDSSIKTQFRLPKSLMREVVSAIAKAVERER